MKHSVKKIVNKFGLDIVRYPAVEEVHDLRSQGLNPYSLLYRLNSRVSVLFTLSLMDARDPFFFSYDSGGNHPYVRSARIALESESYYDSIYRELTKYYNNTKLESAADYLELKAEELSKIEPWGFVWPWETTTSKNKIGFERSLAENSGKMKLGIGDLNLSYGWKYAGPASEELIVNESLRIKNLMKRIYQDGYSRHNDKDGDIVATILENRDGEWRWSISSGMHRAAVISALGYSEVPVRVRGIIRESDSKVWPNVMNGFYSELDALKVFDRHFNAVPAQGLQNWWQDLNN